MYPTKITLNTEGVARYYDKMLSEEEYLGLFLGPTAGPYYDVIPYSLFLPNGGVSFIDSIH